MNSGEPSPTLEDPPTSATTRGKVAIAVAGTLFFPGIGHLLNRDVKRGLWWTLSGIVTTTLSMTALIIPTLFLAILWIGAFHLIFFVFAFVDAIRRARQNQGVHWLPVIARYALALILLTVIVVIRPQAAVANYVRENFVQSLTINGGSMSPTIQHGDAILSHAVDEEIIRRWSIVTIVSPLQASGSMMARVVGLPGERVEIIRGAITINGEPVTTPPGVGPYETMRYMGRDDPKLRGRIGAGCQSNPIILGEDEYFVLGDNSKRALDARLWETPINGRQLGALPRSQITGVVTGIYWPLSRYSSLR